MKIDKYTQDLELIQFQQNILEQISSINIGYLGISVSIILGFGLVFSILMYFFNFKPTIEKLSKQEDMIFNLGNDIEKERKKNEEKIQDLIKKEEETFSSLIKRIGDIEQKSSEQLISLKRDVVDQQSLIKNKIETMEIMEIWYRHYIWKAQKVPANVISTLTLCLEKSLNNKQQQWMVDLCLEEINDLFDLDEYKKIKSTDTKIVNDLKIVINKITNLKNSIIIEKILNNLK